MVLFLVNTMQLTELRQIMIFSALASPGLCITRPYITLLAVPASKVCQLNIYHTQGLTNEIAQNAWLFCQHVPNWQKRKEGGEVSTQQAASSRTARGRQLSLPALCCRLTQLRCLAVDIQHNAPLSPLLWALAAQLTPERSDALEADNLCTSLHVIWDQGEFKGGDMADTNGTHTHAWMSLPLHSSKQN